jgi:glycosyltransferase involved in cell wall biosynthesis
VVNPPVRHPLFWKWWYDVQIPRVLKKIKADVFLAPGGVCSLRTPVPQCLVVHDLHFLQQPQQFTPVRLWFYKRYTARFLKKATGVATVFSFLKNQLVTRYAIPEAKIRVVGQGLKDHFQPTTLEAQALVKEEYTDGKEFFIYIGTIHPLHKLVNLLKAFSIFKKRQKSSMKLVLAGKIDWEKDGFSALLKTYKYRDDVVVTGYLEEDKTVARLIAAAYALVYPSPPENSGMTVLEAMRCGVPILIPKDTVMQEISGGAALYFDEDNVSEMAEQLMRIYKDEALRASLIERGAEHTQHYTWQQTADALWQSITGCINR